ncbi:MAG: hypothetical protein M3N26_09195, partial [Pseudomonadota bacterium]|nr:hypothetical protein [Pseudomonadota bacterium]
MKPETPYAWPRRYGRPKVDNTDAPSRRKLLQRLTAIPLAIGAFAALQAEAEAKAPQLTVAYRNKPHGN